jgi:type II secretory pathway pseudopilin PulG
MMRFFKKNSGQTLIETIVAIGLLTTGIIGGLSLAITAQGAAEDILNQIIATNLAREGVEVVRNIRDTNWIIGAHAGLLTTCPGIGPDQECYTNWGDYFPPDPDPRNFTVEFTPGTNAWTLAENFDPNFRLYKHPNGLYRHTSAGGSPTIYYRAIILDYDIAAPFDTSPALGVQSIVWWNGKQCPTVTQLSDTGLTLCKIIVEDVLTNWRNY